MIDMSQMDLNLLVALESLLRTHSVTVSATELKISQPAMSRTLQRLRDVLGDPLFVRDGRGVIATERARALSGPVEEAVQAARRVFTAAPGFEPASAKGELVIGLGEEAQVAFADAILSAIWAEAPGINIRIRALSERSLAEGKRGQIDMAIGPDLTPLPAVAGAVDYSDFVAKRLYFRRFVVVSRHGGPMDLDRYCAASHVIVSFEGGGRGFVDDLLSDRGLQRRVAASVTSFPSAARLVAVTDLIATLPEEVVQGADLGLQMMDAPIPLPELAMLLLWHPRMTTDPRHRWLRERVAVAVQQRIASWGPNTKVHKN